MSDRRPSERYLIRTKLIGENLAFIHGPAESGSKARAADQVIAISPHWRILQALGEGIVASLAEGSSAQLVHAVDGTVARPALSGRALGLKQEELEDLQSQISEVEAAAETSSDTVAAILVEKLDKLVRQERQLAETIAVATRQARAPRPHQPVDVRKLLATLGEIVSQERAAQALEDLIHDLRPTEISDLTIAFQAYVALPVPENELVLVGPIRFTTENTTRRLSRNAREEAMANLCLERAWPVTAVAAGVPLITVQRSRQNVAAALSKKLLQLISSKSASSIGGCEAPEVLAVISRHLRLGSPDIEVDPDLEERILKVYVHGDPPGPLGWIQARSDSSVAMLVRQIHSEGSVEAEGDLRALSHWERRGCLKRAATRYVRQTCRCGSTDLALIPTPEVRGLVCLRCREDSSGVSVPPSWNIAVADREYWVQLGYDLAVPPIPGLPTYHLEIDPLTTGQAAKSAR